MQKEQEHFSNFKMCQIIQASKVRLSQTVFDQSKVITITNIELLLVRAKGRNKRECGQ